MTHSSCHLEESQLLLSIYIGEIFNNFIDGKYTLESSQFHTVHTGKYTISRWKVHNFIHTLYFFSSIYGNHDDSYCLIPFSFNPKIISLISPHPISLLIRNVLQRIHKSQFIEFSKKNKKVKIAFGPQNPTKGKFISNHHAPNDSKKKGTIRKNRASLSWRERRREDIRNAEYYSS